VLSFASCAQQPLAHAFASLPSAWAQHPSAQLFPSSCAQHAASAFAQHPAWSAPHFAPASLLQQAAVASVFFTSAKAPPDNQPVMAMANAKPATKPILSLRISSLLFTRHERVKTTAPRS